MLKITVEGGDYGAASRFWDFVQGFTAACIGEDGHLTQIRRRDGGVDYRSPGEYSCVFRSDRDYTTMPVRLELK